MLKTRGREPSANPYPSLPEKIPTGTHESGPLRLRFARTEQDLDSIQSLRFEVFNRELNEGLDESWESERDSDPFDPHCHHMIVEDKQTRRVLGTYRLQTREMAESGAGFYCAGEYQLDQLPEGVLSGSVELGRACIRKNFRNRKVLFLLWRGLAEYLVHNRLRYYFGCCSLTSQSEAEGLKLYEQLSERQLLHPEYFADCHDSHRCHDPGDFKNQPEVEIPTLFKTYLRYGAKIISPPAIDRAFKTIDYLILVDTHDLDPRTRRIFFS